MSSVHLDSPSKYQVAGGTKDDKEWTESNEINVEICMLNVQLFQHVVALLKDTRTLVVLLTLKRFPVVSIDCLQDALEWVSTQLDVQSINQIFNRG